MKKVVNNMMDNYLIEFRFHGNAKFKIRELIKEINAGFDIVCKKSIPHITLAGPFTTSNEHRLLRDFYVLCANSPVMDFEVGDFGTFRDKGVIFLNVKPGKDLEQFRWRLSNTLKSYCDLTQFDLDRNFSFHSTLALKLGRKTLDAIEDYLTDKHNLRFKHIVVRVTLLKNGLILREYDFLLRRSLIRNLAKSKIVYSNTLDALDAYFKTRALAYK